MGATLIGGPLYAPFGYLPPHRPTAEERKGAVEAFQSITPSLEAYGMTLALEPVNRSETFFLRTGEEAAELCAAIGHHRSVSPLTPFTPTSSVLARMHMTKSSAEAGYGAGNVLEDSGWI